MDAKIALGISSYSLRKQPPTIVGLLRLAPLQRAALSNWIEPVKDYEATRACSSMGPRYDVNKSIASLQVKTKWIVAASLGCSAFNDFDCTYEALSTTVPEHGVLVRHWQPVGKGLVRHRTHSYCTTRHFPRQAGGCGFFHTISAIDLE